AQPRPPPHPCIGGLALFPPHTPSDYPAGRWGYEVVARCRSFSLTPIAHRAPSFVPAWMAPAGASSVHPNASSPCNTIDKVQRGSMMKPRVLYFALFGYLSLSGGRFAATFLEHELLFTEEWMVSGAMAVQLLSSSLCSSRLGGVADSLDASKGGRNKGRLLVMSLGLLLSTVSILLHLPGSLFHPNKGSKEDTRQNETEIDSIPLPLLGYHLLLRALFSIGTTGCYVVLDGLTLAQLEREGRDKEEYGKERLYGAVSWGIAHILFGPAIDQFGFKILYATSLISFVGCIITFHLYAKSSSLAEYTGVSRKVEGDDSAVASNDEDTRRKKFKSKTSFDDKFESDAVDTSGDDTSEEHVSVSRIIRLLCLEAPVINMLFIFSIFTLYIGMSVVENLIFLYFEYLGGTNTLCGLTVSVTVLFELPLFHYAPDVLKLLGSPINMLQWGCFAYIVRVIGYSFVPQSHPYWVLALEPLHGITIAFAMTSSVIVADGWVPQGYEASGQGFLSMIRGLGQFFGLCIGGFIEGRTLYRVLAAIVTVGTSILGVGNYYFTTRAQQKGQKHHSSSHQSRNEGIELNEVT
ncbi:hypothetical protein ACHAWF_005473, partial [Thalassiosira exigua]